MSRTIWKPLFQKKTSYRHKGDAARDRRDWPHAEKTYELHLEKHPNDAAIWIQLGHSLKEQDKLAKAERAYRRGVALRPDDEDAAKHLGHLLKRMERPGEAQEVFKAIFSRSGLREMHHEASLLDDGVAAVADDATLASRTVDGDAVFVELDDLFNYLDVHKTVSGIQRVQSGIIQYVLDNTDQKTPIMFVLNELGTNFLWRVEETDLREVLSCIRDRDVDHASLRELIRAARKNAVAVMARSRQKYLIIGAFWGPGGSVVERYRSLKRRGVTIGAYIYDLIPITHTEFCDDGLPHEFTLSFGDGLAMFDFVLTISEYTAREVCSYIERLGLPAKPIRAVPLAHATETVGTWQQQAWGPKTAFLRDRPFVMMVSTIEARKNHNFLVMAWKHFLDEGLDPPDLVFVGREGWRVTSLMEMLKTTRYLDGRVHILHDLSDAELNTLYDACLFTAFPSFVEGWGLPVGESLARGKPCVASSTASIPEVGGDLVDYVDPLNLRDGLGVLHRMAFDEAYRERRAAMIRDTFKPRTWPEVAVDLLGQVDRLGRDVVANRDTEVYFPSGNVFRVGDLVLGRKLPKDYARRPWRMMLTESWYGVESIGCWLRGSRAAVTFRSDLPPGERIVVYLQLNGAPWATADHRIRVMIGPRPDEADQLDEGQDEHPIPKERSFFIHAKGHVGDNGLVDIRFTVLGNVEYEGYNPKNRRFVIGLSTIGYAADGDTAAKAEFLSKLVLSL